MARGGYEHCWIVTSTHAVTAVWGTMTTNGHTERDCKAAFIILCPRVLKKNVLRPSSVDHMMLVIGHVQVDGVIFS